MKNSTLKAFSRGKMPLKRKILRGYLNARLVEDRQEHYIDGDFKWLLKHCEPLPLPEDPTDEAVMNKGAIVSISKTADVPYQNTYAYAVKLAAKFECDLQTVLRLLLMLVRTTPRGVSMDSAWVLGNTVRITDSPVVKMYKRSIPTWDFDKNELILIDSELSSHVHIASLDTTCTDRFMDMVSRIMCIGRQHDLAGITVLPSTPSEAEEYIWIGFKKYTVDGLLRYKL